MIKIVVNPEYEHLRESLSLIPDNFGNRGAVIYKDRNEIRRMQINEYDLVVKSYKEIPIFNRFAYRWLRLSKARRSYQHAFSILNKGLETPKPVAFIECTNLFILKKSFFITEYADYPYIIRNIVNPGFTDRLEVLKAFGDFTFKLHQNDIYHKDYSPGNILFKKQNGRYRFSLVDLNRVKFEKVSVRKGLKNFCRLDIGDNLLEIIAMEYARLRNLPEKQTIAEILSYNKDFQQKRIKKKKLKKLIGHL